jgi:phosphoenolpyruvate phosphomutase
MTKKEALAGLLPLRDRLKFGSTDPAILVGVHNPMTAALVQRAGFSGGWLSSLEVSTVYGIPDRNLISADLVGNVVSAICSRVSLPLMVDADNGYGSPLAAARAARLLSDAGAAGLAIEDNPFPKMNSFSGGAAELESIDDYCAKVSAIRDAVDDDFLVIARTEALIRGHGQDAALKRAEAYEESGADLILIHTRDSTGSEVREVAEAWSGNSPLVTVPTAFPEITAQELGSLGYSMIIYANPLIRAAIWGTQRALALVSDGHPEWVDSEFGEMANLISFSESFADFRPRSQGGGI